MTPCLTVIGCFHIYSKMVSSKSNRILAQLIKCWQCIVNTCRPQVNTIHIGQKINMLAFLIRPALQIKWSHYRWNVTWIKSSARDQRPVCLLSCAGLWTYLQSNAVNIPLSASAVCLGLNGTGPQKNRSMQRPGRMGEGGGLGPIVRGN